MKQHLLFGILSLTIGFAAFAGQASSVQEQGSKNMVIMLSILKIQSISNGINLQNSKKQKEDRIKRVYDSKRKDYTTADIHG